MNAREFYDEIVEPTLNEFDAHFGSKRHAFVAAAVVDALVAHIYFEAVQSNIDPFEFLGGIYVDMTGSRHKQVDICDPNVNLTAIEFSTKVEKNKRNDSYFRERIAQGCDAFRIIRDLAKANKHAVLTKHSPLVKNADDMYSRPASAELGPYGPRRANGAERVMIRIQNKIQNSLTGSAEMEEIYFEHCLQVAYDSIIPLLRLLDERVGRDRREYDWNTSKDICDE